MRLPAKLLLAALAALTVSHLIAVYAESQAAAQTSWLLIGLVVCLALFALVEGTVRRLRELTGL